MKGLSLNQEELNGLRRAHRTAKNKRDADRIKAIYSLAVGHNIAQVASILMVDEETLRNYKNCYQTGGIPALLKTKYKGSECRLSESEIKILITELENQIYLTTQSVIIFVEKEFGVIYSPSGMRDLLHRLGYEYKKPKLVPGNPDIDAQEEFIKFYEDFMQNKPSDAEVLFVDAVHPEHNTMAAYGWFRRGEKRAIKTNSGRQRINLHGAINAETHEVTVIESQTVNKDSTIELLENLHQKYFYASTIYLILDNARYHYSKEVKQWLDGKNVKLVFLPAYSPNLNLIERLWKFFKKNVLYNRYYKDVREFRKACVTFFRNIGRHREAVARLMSADFEMA